MLVESTLGGSELVDLLTPCSPREPQPNDIPRSPLPTPAIRFSSWTVLELKNMGEGAVPTWASWKPGTRASCRLCRAAACSKQELLVPARS